MGKKGGGGGNSRERSQEPDFMTGMPATEVSVGSGGCKGVQEGRDGSGLLRGEQGCPVVLNQLGSRAAALKPRCWGS